MFVRAFSRYKKERERYREETHTLYSLFSFRDDFFEKKNDTHLSRKETEDGREKSSDSSCDEEDENALSFY